MGNYWSAPPGGYYVEGHVDRIAAYALSKLGGLTATASNSYSGYTASQAVDGNTSTSWLAGGGPTQWIEVDLGATHAVRKIRLRVQQSPSGNTSHAIYVGTTPAPNALVASVTQYTSTGQWLDIDLLESNVSGRYIRVETTSSPSWVAWDEIEVYE